MIQNLLLSLLCVWLATGVAAAQEPLKYRIGLKDKAQTEYSLAHPEAFLSERALARRARQHLSVDSTDLPVCRAYVDAIRREGVRIVVCGKWDNFVTVACGDSTCMDRIAALPFVRSIEKVWTAPKDEVHLFAHDRDALSNQPTHYKNSIYGAGTTQIAMLRGDKLHEAGFRGQGLQIAVMDAGFHNADRIRCMRNLHIEGTRNFVDDAGELYAESNHGTAVLSCLAMNCPNVLVGTAPEASYWLLRTEDEYTEHLVEQDYWAAAVEFADSVGVDVVNTSLGYYTFDDETKNYRYCDLDGRYSLMSRQASRMADKGMVLVCSAGNSGSGSWKKITPPADAEHVLAVGAIDKEGVLATFSSVGHTADHRVKPDVMALGMHTAIIGTDGNQARANGTSFSAPIVCGLVACLWQACPQLTARELMERVRQSADRIDCPDNVYGYGVPDFWKAYTSYNIDQP